MKNEMRIPNALRAPKLPSNHRDIIAAPTGLSVKGSRRRATLSWRDNSDNESGFHVERAAEGSSSFSRVASLGADAQNWQDRVPRGTYRYRVQAFNASATSAYTETVTVTVR